MVYYWLLAGPPLLAQTITDSIRLNQVGFYPEAPKVAVVEGAEPGKFFVTTPDLRTIVYTGTLQPAAAGTRRYIADFSACKTPGVFVVRVPNTGISYPFLIQPHVHAALAGAALKSFYYQRASTALPMVHAGRWSRPVGHPDTRVLVHGSAATAQRPAGTVISSPRGWYDAGDYNKYVVNSGITLGTLLSLYEDFPDYCITLRTNIPESGNGLPDVLDEALWNVRWLLTMQDPGDGGVYHKLTNADFDGMVIPTLTRTPRYVVQKSTAAALNFAAVLAQTSRIARHFERQLPGLADSCLRASTRAWDWAQANPRTFYQQAALNTQFEPAIKTGEYGDTTLRDEFAWAATELYVTTRQPAYYQRVQALPASTIVVPSWGQVQALSWATLLRFRHQLPLQARHEQHLQRSLIALADSLVAGLNDRAYRTVMGRRAADYNWGSNANAANQGILLIQAYRLSRDARYLRGALFNLDYLLGRNATGYSFVTGYGTKSPRHPHHRLAEADGIADPLPGFLVGGPNSGRQDSCHYAFREAERAYTDHVCSYASNEVAINWNAPLVYLAVALEALPLPAGFHRNK